MGFGKIFIHRLGRSKSIASDGISPLVDWIVSSANGVFGRFTRLGVCSCEVFLPRVDGRSSS